MFFSLKIVESVLLVALQAPTVCACDNKFVWCKTPTVVDGLCIENYLHHASHLFHLIFPRENWITSIQFRQDAAKTPHIDLQAIRQAQNHFRTTVKTALNICVHALVLNTQRSVTRKAHVRLQGFLYRTQRKQQGIRL